MGDRETLAEERGAGDAEDEVRPDEFSSEALVGGEEAKGDDF